MSLPSSLTRQSFVPTVRFLSQVNNLFLADQSFPFSHTLATLSGFRICDLIFPNWLKLVLVIQSGLFSPPRLRFEFVELIKFRERRRMT